MKYWALDYIDETSCELVYDEKLYANKLEAEAARVAMPRPELFEVNWYTELDLRELFDDDKLEVDHELRIHTSWN